MIPFYFFFGLAIIITLIISKQAAFASVTIVILPMVMSPFHTLFLCFLLHLLESFDGILVYPFQSIFPLTRSLYLDEDLA